MHLGGRFSRARALLLVATLRRLLISITQQLRALPARLVGLLVTRAEEVPLHAQSASQRARVDVSTFAKRSPIFFGAVTVATTAGCGTAAAALVSGKATLVVQIAVAVGGAVIGFLVPVAMILLGCWLTAPVRQRNEARAEFQQRIEPIDPGALAGEFDVWVSARRAATPQYGGRWLNPMFEAKSPMAAVYQQQDTELANIAATTRAEYHARFRDRVRAVLGDDVTDPQTLGDVAKIAERLRIAANDELLAAHAGTLVDGTHLALLKGSIEGGIMSVLNEREVTFGDDPGGAQHNREAVTAHFEALAAELEKWQAAIEECDQRLAAAAAVVPREVTSHKLDSSPFLEDAIVECFTEHLIPLLQRREPLDTPWVQLRCVQDVGAFQAVVGELLLSPERRWSAYQHSAMREYKVAEFDNLMTEFTDEGAIEHNKFVAGLEAQLRDCSDAVTGASEIAEVRAAQEAIKRLKQPLVDELRRQNVSFAPRFATDCPYCRGLAGV